MIQIAQHKKANNLIRVCHTFLRNLDHGVGIVREKTLQQLMHHEQRYVQYTPHQSYTEGNNPTNITKSRLPSLHLKAAMSFPLHHSVLFTSSQVPASFQADLPAPSVAEVASKLFPLVAGGETRYRRHERKRMSEQIYTYFNTFENIPAKIIAPAARILRELTDGIWGTCTLLSTPILYPDAS